MDRCKRHNCSSRITHRLSFHPLCPLFRRLPPHHLLSLFPLTPSSLCLCMLLTCSCCSACSELFVQVSAVKATLVGPLSWSLRLSGSPLREPRGGCHYTHCQWGKHNGLALSIVWAQAWGRHQHLIHSTPVSLLPCPPGPTAASSPSCTQTPTVQCNTGVSLAQPWKTVTDLRCQLTRTSPVQPNPESNLTAPPPWECHTILCISIPGKCNWTPRLDSPRQHVLRGVDNHYKTLNIHSRSGVSGLPQVSSSSSSSSSHLKSVWYQSLEVQFHLFAPSPWLLQRVVHKQNEPHLALAVLWVYSVPQQAAQVPRLWASRSRMRKGQGNHGRVKNRSLLTSQLLPAQTQTSARTRCSPHGQANPADTKRHTSTEMAHLGPDARLSKSHSHVSGLGPAAFSYLWPAEYLFEYEMGSCACLLG